MAAAVTSLLELRGVHRVYRAGMPDEVVALDDVDLKLAESDFATVIGSNGAGKSTLLAVIAGTQPLDAGRVVLEGRDVSRLPAYARARSIGRVAQDPRAGTAESLTVEENLALALLRGQARGLGRGVTEARRALFRAALEDLGLGLEDRLGARVGTLSGGQRQALTLLLATLRSPRLLLLDEHVAALDPRTAPLVLDITRRLVEEQRITTLMVTHNVEHALVFGNRLLMLHAGRIVLDVSADEKRALGVPDLIARYEHQAHARLTDDRVLLRDS
jgi:putative tryptophan/tyrosine transport system ATP-binding protein